MDIQARDNNVNVEIELVGDNMRLRQGNSVIEFPARLCQRVVDLLLVANRGHVLRVETDAVFRKQK